MAPKTVDEYVAGLEGWQAAIAHQLRKIVKTAAPQACESIKWAQPVFEMNGPFAYIKAFRGAVNFGFWRGSDLDDPAGVLQGSGEKMRHIKLAKKEDIDGDVLLGFVKQAVALNVEKGDPAKGK